MLLYTNALMYAYAYKYIYLCVSIIKADAYVIMFHSPYSTDPYCNIYSMKKLHIFVLLSQQMSHRHILA